MPPTATLEDIKAYQQKVEKNKITPYNLPPCPRCSVEPEFFKIHAYRERRFLIIIEMLIKAAYCSTDVRVAYPAILLVKTGTDKTMRLLGLGKRNATGIFPLAAGLHNKG